MSPTTALPQMSTAENYEALCRLAVEKILALSQKAIKAQGRFTFALSGGTTPQGVYALMSTADFRDQFDWKNIYLFLGDERFVPSDSPRSNDQMIRKTLISKVNIPPANFYAVNTATSNVEACATDYEHRLIKFFDLKPQQFPSFDLVLLGLGQDGHTASLFPGHPGLQERQRLVIPVVAQGIPEARISMTLPVINQAKVVSFLVSGADKAAVLKKIREGKDRASYPAGQVNPAGEWWWLIDRAAASLL